MSANTIEYALSELLRLAVEWQEAALSEIDVARKAHAITRLWGQHVVAIVAAARREADATTAEHQKAAIIMRAIVEADERGQGLPFQEAMGRAIEYMNRETDNVR